MKPMDFKTLLSSLKLYRVVWLETYRDSVDPV
jgi:hypothetical protein